VNDDNLIHDAVSGSERAFTALYKKYSEWILYYISLSVQDKEDCKDLRQITFTRAFLNITKYNFTSSFSTWLTAIAQNIIIDYVRKKSCMSRIPQSFITGMDECFDIRDERFRPDHMMIKKERDDFIKAKAKKFKHVWMHYFEGMTLKEIGEHTGTPLTIKVKMFRERRKLEEELCSVKS
jgi:RNA polymerase sigma-70 factor (ECF subfamily)